MRYLESSTYSKLDRSKQLPEVQVALNEVIHAEPTQIRPEDRTAYLDAILSDLEDREDAPWTDWAEELLLLALTAIKTLGRNPIGSETLLSKPHLHTILHHTSLPLPPSPSPFSHSPSPTTSLPALEALKVLANLLVLHSTGRDAFAELGGAKATAQALRGVGIKDQDENADEEEEEDLQVLLGPRYVERLFLLGRIGFLVTLERPEAVKLMVDKEDLVNSLCFHLATVPCAAAHLMALTELLKLVNNVIRFYPHCSTSASSSSEQWEEVFDPLLPVTLQLLYSFPFSDLAPPLSTTLHVLLAIPFLPRLLPYWHAVPTESEVDGTTSPSQTFKNMFSKISLSGQNGRKSSDGANKASISSIGRKTPTPPSPERSLTASNSLSPGKSSSRREWSSSSKTSSHESPPRPNHSKETSASSSNSTKLKYTLLPTTKDPSALPKRVFGILGMFFDKYMSGVTDPEGHLEKGLMVEEILPPILLLLSRAAEGSEEMRRYMKNQLLPSDLDRSVEAGPLEDRSGMLGTLLRLMGSTKYPQTRDSAGELLWTVCDSDASTLSAEIGYGLSAGLLFYKGISGPPPAKITEINDDLSASTSKRSSNGSAATLHPITALKSDPFSTPKKEEMSEAEKNAEAEKLFDLFQKLEKNPVLSAKGADGAEKPLNEVMEEKYNEVDANWGEKERTEQEEEERKDEEEAMREMEAYRKRLGR